MEYSRLGNVVRGQEKAVAKSKYEEDVYVNNHTSVWGSYWREGQWGYSCCHSLVKLSYCTGEAGRLAQLVLCTYFMCGASLLFLSLCVKTSQFTVVMSERKAEEGEDEEEGEEEEEEEGEEGEEEKSLLEQHKASLEASGKTKKERRKEREKQEAEKAALCEEKIKKVSTLKLRFPLVLCCTGHDGAGEEGEGGGCNDEY